MLKNYPGEHPVIQPGDPGQPPPGHGVLLQAQEGYQEPIGWITIEGFEIRYGWDGVENCVVQNNIFYKNGGVNGVLFYTQQDRRHLVRNNIFYPPVRPWCRLKRMHTRPLTTNSSIRSL